MAKIDFRGWGLVGVVSGPTATPKQAKEVVSKRSQSNPEYEYAAVKKNEAYHIYGRLKKAIYVNTI